MSAALELAAIEDFGLDLPMRLHAIISEGAADLSEG